MTAARALHVRCSTWDQVELFTTRKLRHGKLLSMRVPFAATVGTAVTLGLELPNQLVIAIDGFVKQAGVIETKRTWIEVELIGLTDEILSRIAAMVSYEADPPTDPQVVAVLSTRNPIEEVKDDLPADERELFQALSGELRRLRAAAVHDVLGVPVDASPDVIRRGWKSLLLRYHPDIVARRQVPAVTHLAEELTILANRAYDRMRAALVAEGRGVLAGSSIAAPSGWLVGLDDMVNADDAGTSSAAGLANGASDAHVQDGDAFEARARSLLEQGATHEARELLAGALVIYPHSKPLRSLYHVSSALIAVHDGEVMRATSQLETALAQHEHCYEAARLLEYIRAHGAADPADLRRLLQ